MKAVNALILPLILLAAVSTVGQGRLKIDPESRHLLLSTIKTSTMQKELDEASAQGFRIISAASSCGQTGMVLFLQRAAQPPDTYKYRLPAAARTSTVEKELNQAAQDEPCQYKTIGVPEDQGKRLSFSYDLKRLAAAMRRKRGYEVAPGPGGNELRISRTFNGVKYNIIFEGGEPLSFNLNTVNDDEADSNVMKRWGERCGTPDRLIRRRAYRMIGDLPLETRQKAELKAELKVYEVVLGVGLPAPRGW